MTDKPDLRERVEQLEQTVQQQAEIIDDYLPDDPRRRKFLTQGAKGVGAVAGLGLAYDHGTESAEAATGNFDVGVPGDRATLYAAEVLDDNDTKLADMPNGGPVEFPQGVSAKEAKVTEVAGRANLNNSNQTIASGNRTQVNLDQSGIEGPEATVVEVDLSDNKLIAKKDGIYSITASARFLDSSNWSDGNRYQIDINVGGSIDTLQQHIHDGSDGTGEDFTIFTTTIVDINNPPMDIFMEIFHESGGDETIVSNPQSTMLNVSRLG